MAKQSRSGRTVREVLGHACHLAVFEHAGTQKQYYPRVVEPTVCGDGRERVGASGEQRGDGFAGKR
jgi:hypothetical protein